MAPAADRGAPKPEEVLFSWSGGKDSALALYEVTRDPRYRVVSLLTTVTEDYGRVSMHGVRQVLLEQQARSLGLPLAVVPIAADESNEGYEARMQEALTPFLERGVASVAFGDIHLEDVRAYRERNLARVGMRGLFPLWHRDGLPRRFIDLGFAAVVTCIDTRALDGDLCGRHYDEAFLAALPPHVDANGENGEFHTFVFDGPLFRERVAFTWGEVVARGPFSYCDLVPRGG